MNFLLKFELLKKFSSWSFIYFVFCFKKKEKIWKFLNFKIFFKNENFGEKIDQFPFKFEFLFDSYSNSNLISFQIKFEFKSENLEICHFFLKIRWTLRQNFVQFAIFVLQSRRFSNAGGPCGLRRRNFDRIRFRNSSGIGTGRGRVASFQFNIEQKSFNASNWIDWPSFAANRPTPPCAAIVNSSMKSWNSSMKYCKWNHLWNLKIQVWNLKIQTFHIHKFQQ